jgi:hypothetical protein
MSTESKLTEALREIAGAGTHPDERAAWQAIVGGVAADRARSRRARWTIGLGAAAASAAAATALVLGMGDDDRQAVQVVTPATDAPSPTSETQASTLARPLPAEIAAVVTEDGRSVQLWDLSTEELITTSYTAAEPRIVVDVALASDGTLVWAEAGIVVTEIKRMDVFDGAIEVIDLGLADGTLPTSPALSPDGSMLSVGLLLPDPSGQGLQPGALAIHDLDAGTTRILEWAPGEAAVLTQPQDLDFSRDGRQLLFTNVHDSDGTETFDAFVIDVDATSLSEATLVDADVWSAAWGPEDGIISLRPAPEGTGRVLAYIDGGPEVGLPPLPDVLGIVSGGTVLLGYTDFAGVWRLDAEHDTWVKTRLQSSAVALAP